MPLPHKDFGYGWTLVNTTGLKSLPFSCIPWWSMVPPSSIWHSGIIHCVTANRNTLCFSLQPFCLPKQYNLLSAPLSLKAREPTRSCDWLLSPYNIWRIPCWCRSSCHLLLSLWLIPSWFPLLLLDGDTVSSWCHHGSSSFSIWLDLEIPMRHTSDVSLRTFPERFT